jgi:hypothetical protein
MASKDGNTVSIGVKIPPGALPWLMKKCDLDGVDKFAPWVLTLQQYVLFETNIFKPSEQVAVKSVVSITLTPSKRPKMGMNTSSAFDLVKKFVVGRAVASTSSSESIRFLREDLIHTFGSPRKLISDNGTGFTSKAFDEFTDEETD